MRRLLSNRVKSIDICVLQFISCLHNKQQCITVSNRRSHSNDEPFKENELLFVFLLRKSKFAYTPGISNFTSPEASNTLFFFFRLYFNWPFPLGQVEAVSWCLLD